MSKLFRLAARSFGALALLIVGTALPWAAFAAEPLAAGASSQMAVRDAASGNLRAPTSDEALALQPHLRSGLRPNAAGESMPEKSHSSGARGSRLPDEYLSYSVMVRGANGQLIELCFQSREAAEAALLEPPVSRAGANLPTE